MAYSDTSSRKRGCIVLMGLGVLLLVLPAGWLMGRPYASTVPRSFDPQAWKAADPTSWPADDTRCSMIADLRLQVGIEGRTRDEVVALLGEPEDRRREPSVSYWLLCPSFLDVWVLGVRWENGRAVDAVVHDT